MGIYGAPYPQNPPRRRSHTKLKSPAPLPVARRPPARSRPPDDRPAATPPAPSPAPEESEEAPAAARKDPPATRRRSTGATWRWVYVYEEGEPPILHAGPCKDIYTIEGRFIEQLELMAAPAAASFSSGVRTLDQCKGRCPSCVGQFKAVLSWVPPVDNTTPQEEHHLLHHRKISAAALDSATRAAQVLPSSYHADYKPLDWECMTIAYG